MLYIGIDPGVSVSGPGCVALIDDNAHLLGIKDIPIVKINGRGKLDIPQLHKDMKDLIATEGKGDSVFLVVIEEPLMIPGKRGAFSIAKASHCFGVLESVCIFMGIPYLAVKPAIWKKAVLSNTKAEKGDSILAAKGMFPNSSELLKRKKDHNRAEAMLMAFYSLIKSGRARLIV